MAEPGRHEHERAGAGDDLLALHAEGELALEDVERVVLVLVQVLGWPAGVRLAAFIAPVFQV